MQIYSASARLFKLRLAQPHVAQVRCPSYISAQLLHNPIIFAMNSSVMQSIWLLRLFVFISSSNRIVSASAGIVMKSFEIMHFSTAVAFACLKRAMCG